MKIKILRNVMEANDEIALQTRNLLREKGVLALNLIGSPGSGKTSLLERTIEKLKPQLSIAVVEGDIATIRDAERIARLDVPVVQLHTDGECHLQVNLVRQSLADLNLEDIDILFIENVGNLVCPVEFDLGEFAKVGVLSVAEGDDKPLKYPLLFRKSGCIVLNKIDLLPYVDFERTQFYSDIEKIDSTLKVIEVSCRTGEGIEDWVDWLQEMQSKCVKRDE
ncbi:hydrogenase nickel incorporation protein HypB [Candidatus Poribacteria bacterium]|nr:hydrogenase nickel incorporation protein HypB [Candidatus Poribacteria bacterium]